LRNAIVETQKDAAQLPVRRGRRQRIAQPPQQPLTDQHFLCDTHKPTASRILDR
jgi:hypothetical protein